jgi:hypothetical protein
MTAVLVRHDPGCKWARFDGEVDADANILSGEVRPGHSDAAKRFSDVYNLHRAAGITHGWIAGALADGSSDGEVYESRGEAVAHMWPNEDWYFYATLQQPTMTVCAAEALLRYKRVMNQIEAPHTDRDAPHGGLEVIPRLANEDQEAQIEAIRTGRGHVALGYRKD